MTPNDISNRRSTYPTNPIRIEPSLRLTPGVDALGMTRGNFRQLSTIESMPKIASHQTERIGSRTKAQRRVDADRAGGEGGSEIPDGRRGVWGTADAIVSRPT